MLMPSCLLSPVSGPWKPILYVVPEPLQAPPDAAPPPSPPDDEPLLLPQPASAMAATALSTVIFIAVLRTKYLLKEWKETVDDRGASVQDWLAPAREVRRDRFVDRKLGRRHRAVQCFPGDAVDIYLTVTQLGQVRRFVTLCRDNRRFATR